MNSFILLAINDLFPPCDSVNTGRDEIHDKDHLKCLAIGLIFRHHMKIRITKGN